MRRDSCGVICLKGPSSRRDEVDTTRRLVLCLLDLLCVGVEKGGIKGVRSHEYTGINIYFMKQDERSR